MDLTPFKLDIDDLVNEFIQKDLTALADMKTVWEVKNFSYIYEGQLKSRSAFSFCFPVRSVIWFQQLFYHEDWLGSIAYTVFMRLSHIDPASRFTCLLGEELGLGALMKMSAEYGEAKQSAVREVAGVIKIEQIKHIAVNNKFAGQDS